MISGVVFLAFESFSFTKVPPMNAKGALNEGFSYHFCAFFELQEIIDQPCYYILLLYLHIQSQQSMKTGNNYAFKCSLCY